LAKLTQSETGAFSAVPASGSLDGVNVAQLPVSNGTATAVWEVLDSNFNALENFEFGVWIQSGALLTGTVTGSAAPVVPGGSSASQTLPIPRFTAGMSSADLAKGCAVPTTTSLTAPTTPVLAGAAVSFTATVTSSNASYTGAPAGVVTLLDGGVPIPGTATGVPPSGIATFSASFASGNHTLTARFVSSDSRQLDSVSQVVVLLAAASASVPAPAPYYPQISKIDPAVGSPVQNSYTVSLSADGNTLLLGSYSDTNYTGAAWIYERQNGVWTQRAKLVPSDAVASTSQAGTSVALSADGNTAIIGGPGAGDGASWVFVRDHGSWVQQAKLVGSGVVNSSTAIAQGFSVAVSADGNTAAVGGPGDNSAAGAVWIFTRTVGNWSQQGPKLVGSGASGTYFLGNRQGTAVSLSGDGNTLIAGAPNDGDAAGAVWIFTRSSGVWSQAGPKLAGNTGVEQGASVAISGDGQTAIIGKPGDVTASNWAFTKVGGSWIPQGPQTTGATRALGNSVAISGDGNIAALPGAGFAQNPISIFRRASGIWTRDANPVESALINAGNPLTVLSVSMASDGLTVAAGAADSTSPVGQQGGVWIFTQPVPSITTLVQSPSPAGTTFTAAVSTANLAISGPVAGSVTFYDSGVAIPGSTTTIGSGGIATFTTGFGSHRISAAFSPSTSFLLPSVSSEVALSGGRLSPTVALSSSTWPSMVGQSVTFTANVSGDGAIPTGTVRFSDGSHTLGTSTVTGGQAVFTTKFTNAATHDIYAFYSGDGSYSDGFVRFGQWVDRVGAALTLAADHSTAAVLQPVMLTAQLTAPPPGAPAATGQIQFLDGGVAIGAATIANGTASYQAGSLAAGAHLLVASYSGDPNWYAIRSQPVTVTVSAAATATVLSAVYLADQTQLVAKVSGPASMTLSGSVQFVDADTKSVLGSASLSGTQAALAIPLDGALAIAGHSIEAIYSGKGNLQSSTSNALKLAAMVNAAGKTSEVFAPDELVSILGGGPGSITDLCIAVVDSAGASRNAVIGSVSPEQAGFVLPHGMASGPATLTLSRSGAAIYTATIRIAAVAPALFSQAQILRVHADGTTAVESAASPIAMGSDVLYLVVYGTGIRNRSGDAGVVCIINGRALPVLYAGEQPGSAGVDQVNVRLPGSLSGAGPAAVSVTVDGAQSNAIALMFQ
jgi:uncharacterized protein (TIGR03437 family)